MQLHKIVANGLWRGWIHYTCRMQHLPHTSTYTENTHTKKPTVISSITLLTISHRSAYGNAQLTQHSSSTNSWPWIKCAVLMLPLPACMLMWDLSQYWSENRCWTETTAAVLKTTGCPWHPPLRLSTHLIGILTFDVGCFPRPINKFNLNTFFHSCTVCYSFGTLK